MPFGQFPGENDPFGNGGITHQLDHHLRALQYATWLDDPLRYANLVAQVAAILRPKLTQDEYKKLSSIDLSSYEPSPDLLKRELRLEREQAIMQRARDNLAELLKIASEKGIYAKKDESEAPANAEDMALKGP